MISLINHLRNRPQYPTRDIRHVLNNYNEEIIQEIEHRLRLLDSERYTATVTVSENKEGTYKLEIDSIDADTAKRITYLVQPYLDSLNSWSDQ